MSRVALVCIAGALVALLVAGAGRASLHHPDDPMAVPVNEKGEPEPYPFLEFKRRLLVLRNAGDPRWPLIVVNPESKDPEIDKDTGQPRKTDRGVVKDRIDRRKALPKRSEVDSVALAVDLLRYGQSVEAETVLPQPRVGYLPNVTMAHLEAARGEWGRAYSFLDIANEYAADSPPESLPGLTPQQLKWQLKLNAGPLLALFRARKGEPSPPRPTDDDHPDAIFPVNFTHAGPLYEPWPPTAEEGKPPPDPLLLAAGATARGALRAGVFGRLSPDALATAQQLVLWFPQDPRLYWLLGELYAERGEYITARSILNECVESYQYSNRKLLMQHREIIARAAETQRRALPAELPLAPAGPEKPPDGTPQTPFSMNTIWLYFGLVAAVVVFALARSLMRRKRGDTTSGPVG